MRVLVLAVVFSVSTCQCGGPPTAVDGGQAGGEASDGGGGGQAGGSAAGGGLAGGGEGGGTAAGLDAGLMEFCQGTSPVPVAVGGSTLCVGDLGKRTFTFAFCSCRGITANNQFRIGSLSTGRDGGGSVGTNGTFTGSNNTVVNGTLWAAQNVTSSNNLTVGRDLVCGANVSLASGRVGRDLVAAGSASASGAFRVDGTVRVSPASTVMGLSGLDGGLVRAPLTVAAPCDCANPVAVAGIVSFFQSVSDNAARGVSPTALSSANGVNLTLECGRYVFQGVNATGPVRIRTRDRVVIAVVGDVTSANQFELSPDPGSQVDVFVSGNLALSNNATLGDPGRPAATRIYVGGTQVTASNALELSANLYAGRATFSANNNVDMRGALFVDQLSAANSFSVAYDDAILNLDGCASADAGCSSCRQCANPTPACRNGSCGRCQTDADCCPPLSCEPVSGQCFEGVIQ